MLSTMNQVLVPLDPVYLPPPSFHHLAFARFTFQPITLYFRRRDRSRSERQGRLLGGNLFGVDIVSVSFLSPGGHTGRPVV